MKEFLVDEPVTPEFLQHLCPYGTVSMLASLLDGYYLFEKPRFFSVKGFLGDRQFEVRFVKEHMDLTVDFLYLLVSRYPATEKDRAFLRSIEESIQEKLQVRTGEG